MRITDILGLKLPEGGDFYNVEDFNENFEAVESAINSMASIVTGIMTANGTMELGFQPKVVFVFGTMFSPTSPTFGNSIAMAFPGAFQRSPTQTALEVTETGFITDGLMGGHNAAVSVSFPLRYVAFR
ncbi:MAG: hypothetical protein FWD34_10740 [Oscillospiraceae bacterium]|nr:hypothetical protein [Oscillospiraceae bacterium]